MLRSYLRYAPLALLTALPFVGCAAEDKKAGLVVALQTDMSIPKDVDAVEIEISAYGNVLHKNTYDVGEGGLNIPATLTILPGEDKNPPVTIRVISYQNREARTLRKVITTVPDDREALLRMPIQWLCDGQVEEKAEDSYASSCSEGESCVAGTCATDTVDVATLPSYSDTALFGGKADGSGACFDTVPCMAAEMQWLDPALFDAETCTISLSSLNSAAGAGDSAPQSLRGPGIRTLEETETEEHINFALSFPPGSDGICGEDENEAYGCFIPLDQDAETGWSIDGDKVKLPAAVCERISQLDAKVSLVTSPACPTKTADTPTCGAWSSVGGSKITVELPPPTGGSAGAPAGTGSVGNLNYTSVPFVAPNGNISVDSPALTGTLTATYDSECIDTEILPMTFEGQQDLCTSGMIGMSGASCDAGYRFNILNADPSIIGLGFELGGATIPTNAQLIVHQGTTEFCTFVQAGMNNILFRDLTQDCESGGAQMVDPTIDAIEIRTFYPTSGGEVALCLDKLSALIEP